MKKDKSLKPVESAPPPVDEPQEVAQPVSLELGLTERRRLIRPLPVPEVVESNGDSVWGTYQSLIAQEEAKK